TDFNKPAWVFEFLRNKFSFPQASGGIRTVGVSARIYLPQHFSMYRRLLNEDELWHFLDGYGFKKVRTQDLSFKERVSLFKDAEVILGPHGPGLRHVVFSRTGAKLIEIFKPDFVDPTCWAHV
ncbi:MAG: glycosyltransferase family 61 protein, partial [Candidatus Omnitrophica bacterium]|nr:glycosyltransferase family 61 protein [Candidatus Omnitrophota bacterium]